MNMLVAYDIGNPRRLNKIAKIMKDYGLRVQRSIFEIDVSPPGFACMRQRVEAVMDPCEDGVKYFPCCAPCSEVWFSLGVGSGPSQTSDEFIVV
jgi:CRISPR-associated protein Cas2